MKNMELLYRDFYLKSIGGEDKLGMTDSIINIYNVGFKRDMLREISKEKFVELIEEYKISLYRVGKGILKNDHDVEDAVSETVLKSFKNLNKLKDINSFKSWIMRILVNECYTILNKKKRIEFQEDIEVYNLAYEDTHQGNLINYINKLDKDSSAILTLFYYEDMSIKDISEVLEISNGTVKSRLSRSKEKLKKLLENCEWGEYNE